MFTNNCICHFDICNPYSTETLQLSWIHYAAWCQKMEDDCLLFFVGRWWFSPLYSFHVTWPFCISHFLLCGKFHLIFITQNYFKQTPNIYIIQKTISINDSVSVASRSKGLILMYVQYLYHIPFKWNILWDTNLAIFS